MKHSKILASWLRVSVSSRKGKERETMEDRVVIRSFGDFHIIAVLDGHGGEHTVQWVAKHLITILKKCVKDDIRQGLRDAFGILHEKTKHNQDGTTISLLLINTKTRAQWLAHLGDSTVVGVSREKGIKKLSIDHKPHLKSEQSLLKSSEFQVKEGYLTLNDGDGIAMTRSLGDKAFDHVLNREPTIHHITSSWEVIVLASDGLWDVLKGETLLKLLAQDSQDWENSAKRLNDYRHLHFPQHDNCSIVIVFIS